MDAHCCRVTEAQGESGRVGQARRCRFTRRGDGVGEVAPQEQVSDEIYSGKVRGVGVGER